MSIPALNWALETTFGTPTRKSVMVVLANYADAHWSSFVGQERIAHETELGIRTVRRCMTELEMIGVIKKNRRYHGRIRTSDRIHLDRNWVPATLAGACEAGASVAADAAEYRPDRPQVPATVAGEPLVEPSVSNEPPVSASADEVCSPEVEALCQLLAERIGGRQDGKRPAVTERWRKDMRLLVERGPLGREKPEHLGADKVRTTIEFVFAKMADPVGDGGFCWADPVQSPAALRKHWDKMKRAADKLRHQGNGKVQSWSPASAPTGRQFGGSLA